MIIKLYIVIAKTDKIMYMHKQGPSYTILRVSYRGKGGYPPLAPIPPPPKICIQVQWNPSITDTFGEQFFGLYTEVVFVERLFCTQLFIWDRGAWLLYSNWPLFGGGC